MAAGIPTARCGSIIAIEPNGWGDFVHESVQGGWTGGSSRIEPAALHLRLTFRALEDAGPLHNARRRGVSPGKQKIGLGNLILDPAWTFLRSYVLQRGFLDGLEGLTIAHMAAIYTFLKYAKARNMSPQ